MRKNSTKTLYPQTLRFFMTTLQEQFEKDVYKIKKEGGKLNLVNHVSKKWNYPKYNKSTHKTKPLPRTCSGLIRKHLSSKWIPKDCKLDYCVLSKGKNNCCIDPDDYIFGDPLNLKWLMQQRFGLDKLDFTVREKVTEFIMRDAIDEKTENCKLDIIIDAFVLKFYMKRVKPAGLASSIDVDEVLFVYIITTFTQNLSDKIYIVYRMIIESRMHQR